MNKNNCFFPQFEHTLSEISEMRQLGKRIVFTNGCFDIIHAGHVRCLSQAREMGDYLVVGLNSDDSVRRLKGDDRPINTQEDRMSVLLALACVDWVIIFGESLEENDTPEELIRLVRPDVLAKGGDYTVDSIVGSDFVIGEGGDVVILQTLEGHSTTRIINKVRNLSFEHQTRKKSK